MCGFCGIIINKNSIKKEELIHKGINYNKLLSKRGPDEFKYKFFELDNFFIYLGFNRLSIMDLSSFGSQPMSLDNLHIMFNGMIYNHKELKYNYNYDLIGSSDTEILLNEINKNGYQNIKGMFALSIFDHNKKTVELATDLFGQKPLYYYYNKDLLFFSSTLLPLIETELIEKKLDSDSINSYELFNFIPAPKTIFKNIFKMDNNQLLKFKLNGDIKLVIDKKIKNNDFLYKKKINYTSFLEETHRVLESSINKHLIADVPISSLQSGGIDSSLINLYISKHNDIKTYSVIFDSKTHSEENQILDFTKNNHIDNTLIKFSDDSINDVISNTHNIFDEPFADSSLINQFLIFNEVSKFTTCCITGDGGDELFFGYNRHRYFSLFKLINKFGFGKIIKFLPIEKIVNLYNSNSSLSLNQFEKIINLIKDNNYKVYENYLSIDYNHIFSNKASNKFNSLNELLELDKKIYMKNDILVKIDRSSMSNSIESRAPFLYDDIFNHINKYDIKPKKYLGKKILKDISVKYFNVKLNSLKKGFTFDLENKFLRNNKFQNMILSNLSDGQKKYEHLINSNLSAIKNDFLLGNNRFNYQIWNKFVLINWLNKYKDHIISS